MEDGIMIAVEGLTYGIDRYLILDNVDFRVTKGETLVIMGPSGCGKSTLLRLIAGLIPPLAGRIYLGGREVVYRDRPSQVWAKPRLGMLFQSAALFDSLTVGENVAFGLRRLGGFTEPEIRGIVREKLAIVGLPGEEVPSKMPAELSGGMKKRVGLARAIAIDPEIILYDEPTTGLDPIMSNIINNMIRHLQKTLQVTSLVVTHDLNCATMVGDMLSLLYGGSILEMETCDKFLKSESRVVRQFLKGEAEGPISAGGGDLSNADDF